MDANGGALGSAETVGDGSTVNAERLAFRLELCAQRRPTGSPFPRHLSESDMDRSKLSSADFKHIEGRLVSSNEFGEIVFDVSSTVIRPPADDTELECFAESDTVLES